MKILILNITDQMLENISLMKKYLGIVQYEYLSIIILVTGSS